MTTEGSIGSIFSHCMVASLINVLKNIQENTELKDLVKKPAIVVMCASKLILCTDTNGLLHLNKIQTRTHQSCQNFMSNTQLHDAQQKSN